MRARMSPAEAAQVLGVPIDASLEEIQHAYLRAARHLHPDALPDASDPEREDAALRFGELTQAREVLLEHHPVVPIRVVVPAAPEYERGRGIGGSLAVLALLVFLLIAIVSLNDAFRASMIGTGGGESPSVSTSAP
jgi:hypothetical protein